MGSLYPLLFKDILKEKIWGGRRLNTIMGKSLPANIPVGESWEISDHGADTSIVANGSLAGSTLHELIEKYGAQLLGTDVEASLNRGIFPLLIKFLDASDRLSVQVHPNNAYAQLHEGPRVSGKTECWYIVHAEPGAHMVVGVKKDTTAARFKQGIKEGTLGDHLATLTVASGDFIYIPSGTLHSIMEGIVLCEIQQNSDTTYRVYDWNRKGLDGKLRQLHIGRSLDTINFAFDPHPVSAGITIQQADNKITTFAACPYFAVQRLQLTSTLHTGCNGRHCICLSVTEGTAIIEYPEGSVRIPKGHSALLPASLGKAYITPEGESCEIIRSFVPDIIKDIINPLIEAGIPRSTIDTIIHP